ncbi:MAG: hypothetical protein IIA63_05485 [Nitrospinae bacterium]|nr:hypothetical protein [Nitrospinota bacterium]
MKNNNQKYAEEVKAWLRENAKQVKGFEVDNLFVVGAIKTIERKDLGPKGYERINRNFKSFKELKVHYGKKISKVNTKEFSDGPAKVSGIVGSLKRIAKRVVGKNFVGE